MCQTGRATPPHCRVACSLPFLYRQVFSHNFFPLLLVVDSHKLTVFYLKSFDMDSVQVGKAVFGKEILSSSRLFLHLCHIYILDFGRKTHCQTSCSIRLLLRLAARAEGGRGLGGKQSGEALASFADSHRTAPAFLGRISE